MLESMPADMLCEWMAYYRIDPFGEDRADLRAGIIASTMANVFRSRGRTFKPADFMPSFEPKKPQSPAEMKAIWESFCRVVNKKKK